MAVTFEQRDGAEVRVETGDGFIESVDAKAGKRNAQVTFRAAHLREPVKAWADGNDAKLVAAVQAAAATKTVVPYRIEVARTSGVDPSLPIADVEKRQKFRRLVALGEDAVAAAGPWGGSSPAGPPAEPAAAATAPASAPAAEPPADPDDADRARAQRIALNELAKACALDEPRASIAAKRTIAVDLGCSAEDCVEAMGGRDLSIEPAPLLGGTNNGSSPQTPADPGPAPADLPIDQRERSEQLRAALNCLWRMTKDGIDPEAPAYADQRQACVDLGATLEQLRVAQGLPDPSTPRDALHRAQDPDGVAHRAEHPYDGSVAQERPTPAARSGLGMAGAAVPRGMVDPAPFKRTHETGPLAGQLNMSSYEVSAVVDLVELAQRILIRRARAAAEEAGADVVAPSLEQVRALAGALKLAADRTQVAVRGGSVDRMSGLYKRAVRGVREAIDWYPAPGPDATREQLAGWHAAIVDHAAATIRAALELLGETLPSREEVAADVEIAGTPAGEPERESVDA